MAGPMKIRATQGGEFTDVRVLMSHPMLTEQQTRGKGEPHFIQHVEVKLNGKTVVNAQVSQAVSRNPFFAFRLKGGAKGDKVEVSWVDNKGETNRIEGEIA